MEIEPRRFRERDPDDTRREYQRRYREANREKLAEMKRRWQQENREAARASGLRFRQRRKAEMIEAYGGQCACCGEKEPTFLTLDHINGNGADERRSFGSRHNANVVARLRREGWPQDGYQLLCWNCQYGVLYGPCPHQKGA